MAHAPPEPGDVIAAREVIRPDIRVTPILTNQPLNDVLGFEAFFKCEHLQATGSFKLRGASYAVAGLPDDCAGVATHSSGNHGAALACAARQRGLAAHVVVPDNAVRVKIENIRDHGGEVHLCRPDQAAREAGLAKFIEQGFAAIPPYDDNRIIAGQGSCALELMEQVENLDIIVTPVGGGGLLAGSALAALAQHRAPRVIGVEPAGADDTIRSLARGSRVTDHNPETIADGLRALVGERNLAIIRTAVEQVIAVDEADIIAAMRLIWTHTRQLVEPSGAVALAGIMTHRQDFAGARVGMVISGGNLDIEPVLATLQ